MKFKKIILLLVSFIMILPTVLFAQETTETCNDDLITINSITVDSKDDSVVEKTPASINGKEINLDLKMDTVGSKITYALSISNGTQEDYAAPEFASTGGDYIDYSFTAGAASNIIPAGTTKTLYLVVTYENPVPDAAFTGGTFQNDENLVIDLTTDIDEPYEDSYSFTDNDTNQKDSVVNPKTGSDGVLLFLIVALFAGGIVYLIITKSKTMKHLVIILGLAIALPLTIYATCTCSLQVNSKVTIEKSSAPTPTPDPTPTESGLDVIKNHVVTSGTGLYKVGNRYIFKGENPNNYIKKGNDLYRIISIESNDTVKVIKDEPISNIIYDPGYASAISGVTSANSLERIRTGGSNDLCSASTSQGYKGCKSWGSNDSTYKIVDGNLSKVTTFPKGTYIKNLPNSDSFLNAYLNGGTFGGTQVTGWLQNYNDTIKDIITESRFYIGAIDPVENQTLQTDMNLEKEYIWIGKVGLMNTSDYVNASSNSDCDGIYNYINTNGCYNNSQSHNYLTLNQPEWVLNSVLNSNSKVWAISSTGRLEDSEDAQEAKAVRPVFYINVNNLYIHGSGTATSPYTLDTQK